MDSIYKLRGIAALAYNSHPESRWSYRHLVRKEPAQVFAQAQTHPALHMLLRGRERF